VFLLVGVVVFRGILTSTLRGLDADNNGVPAAWAGDIDVELSRWGMFAAFTLVALDLGRAWHQTYAFYGGFEPITAELVSTIVNDTLWGSGWKLQVVSAAIAAVAFAGAYRAWPLAWKVALLGAMVTPLFRPLTGHAMEQGSMLSLPVILQAVHVAAAAVWLGTLCVMTVIGMRRTRALAAGDRGRVVAAMVGNFSPLALSAATALFLAGCATSFIYIGSPEAVYSTVYGRVFAAKFIGFCAVLGLGYFNWQKVRPRLDAALHDFGSTAAAPEGAAQVAADVLLLRAAALELMLAALVLGLTAILVALPMPTG